MIIAYKGKNPKIHESAFIAENATLIGDVVVEEGANIWFGAVLRGDINHIRIGKNTNIQDNCVLHVTEELSVEVDDEVTVGHGAILHGCKIGKRCLIGMGATVLDGADVGEESIVAANALVLERKKIDRRSLLGGVPAKKLRGVTDEESKLLRKSAAHYREYAEGYK